MSGLRIDTCPSERVADFVRPISLCLVGREVDVEGAQRFARLIEPERMHAAFDGDEVVGAAGAFSFEMTVPGGAAVPAGGVTVVAVLPSHRRRGLLGRMMRAQLDDMHARGQPLAALFAAEEPIYGRYGYGVASQSIAIQLARQRATLLDPAVGATCRLLEADEAARLLPPIYDAARALRPGMITRSPAWWSERRLRGGDPSAALQRAVVELDGRPAGYALYRMSMRWEDGIARNALTVLEAVGATDAGLREVWRFLLSIDLVEEVSADLLPVDHPLLFLLAEPRHLRLRLRDALWLRLVDVPGALARRVYAQPGTLVVEVADGFCQRNAGRWRLAVDGAGAATVDATQQEPDLALDVAQLATPYLGGFRFTQLLAAGRIEQRRPGAAARADGLFRSAPAPWCVEMF